MKKSVFTYYVSAALIFVVSIGVVFACDDDDVQALENSITAWEQEITSQKSAISSEMNRLDSTMSVLDNNPSLSCWLTRYDILLGYEQELVDADAALDSAQDRLDEAKTLLQQLKSLPCGDMEVLILKDDIDALITEAALLITEAQTALANIQDKHDCYLDATWEEPDCICNCCE